MADTETVRITVTHDGVTYRGKSLTRGESYDMPPGAARAFIAATVAEPARKLDAAAVDRLAPADAPPEASIDANSVAPRSAKRDKGK